SPLLSLTTTPRTAIYTLSLHDALPICTRTRRCRASRYADRLGAPLPPRGGRRPSRPQGHERRADGGTTGPARLRHRAAGRRPRRSEEHTSELQSLRHLVCRLLLEKKKE